MITVDDEIIFYAFRYALGRQTYAVSSVVECIVNNWLAFRENTKEKILREIEEAISEGLARDSKIDVPIWNNVLQLDI